MRVRARGTFDSEEREKQVSGEPRLFKVDRSLSVLNGVKEVDFSDLDVKERKDIQEWVAANPSMIGEDLLFVSKEFSGFDRTRERPDLLAVDSTGCLVVVELKRDDSGTDVHWQAIKYAAYLCQATAEDIVEMLAKHEKIGEEQAMRRLCEHLETQDAANVLNNEQRIILASHRFPPEVTSAALWLNEKAGRPLVTCVTLTPFADGDEILHVLASTIVPVPGDEDLRVGIGTRPSGSRLTSMNDRRSRNRHDGVTEFLRSVAETAKEGVSDGVTPPDKNSRHAGGDEGWRYYQLWHSREPWRNWGPAYRIVLYPQTTDYPEQIDQAWETWVGFVPGQEVGDQISLTVFEIDDGQEMYDDGLWIKFDKSPLNDALKDRIAGVLAKLIAKVTPAVDDLGY